MEQKICPDCGEQNPERAVMCWACWSDLTVDSRPNTWTSSQTEDWRLMFATPAFLIAMFLCSLSGWLPRRARYVSLLAAISLVGGLLWDFVLLPSLLKSEATGEDDQTSIERIIDTILRYALQDGATQVRLDKGVRGTSIYYEIEGAWHEQMRIPNYVWDDLKRGLRRRVTSSQVMQWTVENDEKKFATHLQHEEINPQERVFLRIS